jgi:hypothetical protein
MGIKSLALMEFADRRLINASNFDVPMRSQVKSILVLPVMSSVNETPQHSRDG